eukprot:355932-Chlamydomonas_euryale.AAC.2
MLGCDICKQWLPALRVGASSHRLACTAASSMPAAQAPPAPAPHSTDALVANTPHLQRSHPELALSRPHPATASSKAT